MGSKSTGGLLAGLVALIGGVITETVRRKGNNSSQQSKS